MIWDLQWGSKIDFLEERESEGHVVLALENKPILQDRLLWYIDAFNTLSSRRPTDSIEMPLVLSEILNCIKIFPIFDVNRFVKIMLILDNAYLEYRRNILQQEIEANGNKAVNSRSNNRRNRR